METFSPRKYEAFMGELNTELLVIELGGLFIFLCVWLFSRFHERSFSTRQQAKTRRKQLDAVEGGRRFSNRKFKPRSSSDSTDNAELETYDPKKATMHIPIPWGWPHYRDFQEEQFGLGKTLNSFVGSLVKEKKLASLKTDDPRFINCMHILLEDHYGLPAHEKGRLIPYDKVHAPLLQDPAERKDQMANFGQQQKVLLSDKLRAVGVKKVLQDGTTVVEFNRENELGEIRRPWGW